MVTDTEIFIEIKVVEYEILKIKCLSRFALPLFFTELGAIHYIDDCVVVVTPISVIVTNSNSSAGSHETSYIATHYSKKDRG